MSQPGSQLDTSMRRLAFLLPKPRPPAQKVARSRSSPAPTVRPSSQSGKKYKEPSMPTEVKMPQLGESVTEGTVGKWLKQPGERVEKYESLLEVTTDKVDTEVPAPAAGIVREIMVPEG